jgi:protocatechuate 3,4-dioxygenase beta subunit
LTYPLHTQAYFKEHPSKETSAILKDIKSMAASKEDFNREWNGMEKHVDVLH